MSESQYPEGHPLRDVPQVILDAARDVLAGGVRSKDVDPEAADPLADAVVMRLLPWLVFDADDERIHPMAKLAVQQERLELGLDAGTMDVLFLHDVRTGAEPMSKKPDYELPPFDDEAAWAPYIAAAKADPRFTDRQLAGLSVIFAGVREEARAAGRAARREARPAGDRRRRAER